MLSWIFVLMDSNPEEISAKLLRESRDFVLEMTVGERCLC